MNEAKIKKIILCLYAMAGIQVILSGIALVTVFKASEGLIHSPLILGPGMAWSAILVVGAYIVAKELRLGRPWAWVGAIVLSGLSLSSWAFPAGIIALIHLLHTDIREEYVKKLIEQFE